MDCDVILSMNSGLELAYRYAGLACPNVTFFHQQKKLTPLCDPTTHSRTPLVPAAALLEGLPEVWAGYWDQVLLCGCEAQKWEAEQVQEQREMPLASALVEAASYRASLRDNMRLLTPVTRYGNLSSTYKWQGLAHWKQPWHMPHIASKTSAKCLC